MRVHGEQEPYRQQLDWHEIRSLVDVYRTISTLIYNPYIEKTLYGLQIVRLLQDEKQHVTTSEILHHVAHMEHTDVPPRIQTIWQNLQMLKKYGLAYGVQWVEIQDVTKVAQLIHRVAQHDDRASNLDDDEISWLIDMINLARPTVATYYLPLSQEEKDDLELEARLLKLQGGTDTDKIHTETQDDQQWLPCEEGNEKICDTTSNFCIAFYKSFPQLQQDISSLGRSMYGTSSAYRLRQEYAERYHHGLLTYYHQGVELGILPRWSGDYHEHPVRKQVYDGQRAQTLKEYFDYIKRMEDIRTTMVKYLTWLIEEQDQRVVSSQRNSSNAAWLIMTTTYIMEEILWFLSEFEDVLQDTLRHMNPHIVTCITETGWAYIDKTCKEVVQIKKSLDRLKKRTARWPSIDL